MNTFNQPYPNQFQQGMNFQQPYGVPAQGFGINPANVFQQIQVTDPMTPEEKALLSNKSDKGLNLVLSDEEIAKAKCPHKNQNGMLTAPTSVPNVVKCTQCHEEIDITGYVKYNSKFYDLNVIDDFVEFTNQLTADCGLETDLFYEQKKQVEHV